MGRETAAAMVRQGLEPILAGRDEAALLDLAEELTAGTSGGTRPDIAVVDATSTDQVSGLLRSAGDVLVSTVSPFQSVGEAAVRAALDMGSGYVDCAWEPAFIRRAFNSYGPVAAGNGAVLLPAFGSQAVAGSLAATIAVRRTMTGSRPPARVDVGYFVTGSGRSVAPGSALVDDSFRWSENRLRTERPGTRVRTFEVGSGKHLDALSLGSAEHFTVPRLAASISEVNVFVGWFGRLTRAAAMAGAVGGTASKMPGFGAVWDSMVRGIGGNSAAGGPPPTTTGTPRTVVVAETYDADGAFQQRVRVAGPAPRPLTASLLSWGAGMLLQGAETTSGSLGPAEAFGTEALVSGAMALGLAEIHHRY